MIRRLILLALVVASVTVTSPGQAPNKARQPLPRNSDIHVGSYPNNPPLWVPRKLDAYPKPIAGDPAVKYDYDIVYVRAPRYGDGQQIVWAEVFNPLRAEPGSDLVLLHPDGREEVLVEARNDAIADPIVSFDGEWVFFARFHYKNLGASDLLRP